MFKAVVGDRWMGSALATNEFNLAGMVLCLELTIRTRQLAIRAANDPAVAQYLVALQVSYEIWVAASIAPDSLAAQKSRAEASLSGFAGHLGSSPFEQMPGVSDEMEFINWLSLFFRGFQVHDGCKTNGGSLP